MPLSRVFPSEADLRTKEGLSLDFTNTNDWHASENPVETLKTYADLLDWSHNVGLLSDEQAKKLARHAAREPAAAEAVLLRARALREALYRLLLARIAGRPSVPADLAQINSELPAALSRSRLQPEADGYALAWAPDPRALDAMLWRIAYSAADLLTDPERLSRVGQCADEHGCGWLFLDLSKNHSRRWCDMKACGNRAKARRYYHRD